MRIKDIVFWSLYQTTAFVLVVIVDAQMDICEIHIKKKIFHFSIASSIDDRFNYFVQVIFVNILFSQIEPDANFITVSLPDI